LEQSSSFVSIHRAKRTDPLQGIHQENHKTSKGKGFTELPPLGDFMLYPIRCLGGILWELFLGMGNYL